MPEMFGRYELQDVLGRGGMGEVYRAVDTVRDRTVALKLLPRHLATDENFKTRFRRESRMAARLNDPHIIPIHDFGEIDGQLFIDMRLVEGRDLGSVLSERGSLPPATAVKIIGQIASALEAAHESGLVHRDVKPSNVLLAGWDDGDVNDSEPFAYLVDFGIARAANQEGTALTATSGTVGTVAYMSPERIGGSPGDRRTDIYALGCVLYEAIAGQKPFDGEMFAIMYAHMNNPPPRLTAVVPGAPPALDAVIAKAMAKEPDDRYATASQFALAARQAMRSTPRQLPTPPPSAPPTVIGPPPGHPSGPLPYGPPPAGYTQPSGPVHPSGPVRYGPPPGAYTQPPGQQNPPSAPLPPPAQRPFVQQPPAAQHHTPVPVTPPHNTGPQTGAATAAGGSPPGPVRPTTPSQPVRPPSGWTPPPTSHPSGPVPRPTLPPASPGKRKRGTLLAAGGVAAILAVVLILVFTLGGGGNSPSAHGSNHGSVTGTGGPNTSPATYSTGSASTPTVSWEHFGSYTALVGTHDGDTANAFQDGNCKLSGQAGGDPPTLDDQVNCTYTNSQVTSTVARFENKAAVTALLQDRISSGYSVAPFKIGSRIVGLLYESPASATQIDLITYMCGLPSYLQQFYVQNKTSISEQVVQGNWWQNASFPDVTPQPCNNDFSGPAAGSSPTMVDHGASKTITSISDTSLQAFVQSQHPEYSVALVTVSTGSEIIVVTQKKTIMFWSWNKSTNTLTPDGQSTYPYDVAKLGQPQATARGAVLTGMDHATFIVTGQFSTDQSGNAVAYTSLDGKTWGAIKAQSDGNLKPTNQGVNPGAIGLSANFDFVNGLLETDDCTRAGGKIDCQNLITKFWRWDGTKKEFVLDHTGG